MDKVKSAGKFNDHDTNRIFDGAWAISREINLCSLKQLEGFSQDVESKQDYIVGILLDGLAKRTRIPIHEKNCTMEVRQEDEGISRVDTNIEVLVGLSDVDLHERLKDIFFKISVTYL